MIIASIVLFVFIAVCDDGLGLPATMRSFVEIFPSLPPALCSPAVLRNEAIIKTTCGFFVPFHRGLSIAKISVLRVLYLQSSVSLHYIFTCAHATNLLTGVSDTLVRHLCLKALPGDETLSVVEGPSEAKPLGWLMTGTQASVTFDASKGKPAEGRV